LAADLDLDPAIHGPASRAWHDAERILSEHKPSKTRLDLAAVNNDARGSSSTPFMEAHYFRNGCFMNPGQLWKMRRNSQEFAAWSCKVDMICFVRPQRRIPY
jgi:hypothetical protein